MPYPILKNNRLIQMFKNLKIKIMLKFILQKGKFADQIHFLHPTPSFGQLRKDCNDYFVVCKSFTIPNISSSSSFLYIASILTFGPHFMHSLVYAFLHEKQKLWPQGMMVTGSTINLPQKLHLRLFMISACVTQSLINATN